jgi:beta-glucuronidase
MGCNVIRVFNTIPFNGKLLDDLYSAYGIRVLICDPLGAYTVHSGARWDVGTDYTDPDQLKAMRKSVEETVKQFRSERWLLGYVLGNENNMPADYFGVNAARTRAAVQPEAYAKFLNVIAAMIHTLDPDRIVGVGNMELGLVEAYAAHAPELDFIGVNSYPGSDGFGAMWIRARRMIDRPVLVTEFGCDAYATGKGPDEDAQARYLKNAWEDIAYNAAGGPGEGNSVGGIVFEWLDEWWKDTRGNPPDAQATDPTIELAFPDGFSQEEWLGVVGQRNGRKSPFLRDPRKAYYVLKGLWTKD